MSAQTKLPTSFSSHPATVFNILRDTMSLSTWLAIGAALQIAISVLPVHSVISWTPALTLLLYKLAFATFLRSSRPSTIKRGKWTTSFDKDPRQKDGLVLLIIGLKVSHPLGLLAPGVKEAGDYFSRMIDQLRQEPTKYDFLGASFSLGTEEASSNSLITNCHFRSMEGLHKFAKGELHLKAWKWYTEIAAQHPHLGIFHESYAVPADGFESVYVNCPPMLSGAAVFEGENGSFESALVDSTKGRYRTANGRMGRNNHGEDNNYLGFASPF